MTERDEKPESSRRDFLRKLGVGAAVVTSPVAFSGCFNPYFWHHDS